MPDYPYVYPDAPLRAVEPESARLRLPRRRARRPEEAADPASVEGSEAEWRSLLEEAAGELNASFRVAGAPWHCHIEEDDDGFLLKVMRQGADSSAGDAEEIDEALEPADLPAWLARLRLRLGLLVDERV